MLADWTVNTSNPSNIERGIYTISPMVGTGSLRLKDNDNTNLNMYNTTYPAGLTRGSMRMLIRIMAQGGTDPYRTGFYFQTNDQNLVTGATQIFYTAHIRLDANTSMRSYVFSYYSGGMGGTEQVFFASAPVPLMTNGVSVLPLEVEWQTESELGGVRVFIRGSLTASSLTNFTNMTTLSTLIIQNPPYVINTSLGEGLYYYGGVSMPGGSEIEYDQVSINKLTPN